MYLTKVCVNLRLQLYEPSQDSRICNALLLIEDTIGRVIRNLGSVRLTYNRLLSPKEALRRQMLLS